MNEVEILLVDDNYDDRELALMALRKHKLANKIEIARDGEEALDFLFCRGSFAGRDSHNPPKVVLLDIKMPKVDGLEVLRQLKADARTRGIPIVVMTSSAEQKDMIESYQLGVNSYVQKPVNFEKFQEIIKDLGYYWLVVNQSPQLSPGVTT
jgi:two-component system, response regulator